MNEQELSSNPSILVVEDHPFQLIGIQIQLNRLGFFRLTQALDGAEALALVAQGRRFDLLLCDQYLPDVSGLKLIEQLHRLEGIRHAILISGVDGSYAFRQLLREAQRRKLPLRACLYKPLSPTAFLTALEPLGIRGECV